MFKVRDMYIHVAAVHIGLVQVALTYLTTIQTTELIMFMQAERILVVFTYVYMYT